MVEWAQQRLRVNYILVHFARQQCVLGVAVWAFVRTAQKTHPIRRSIKNCVLLVVFVRVPDFDALGLHYFVEKLIVVNCGSLGSRHFGYYAPVVSHYGLFFFLVPEVMHVDKHLAQPAFKLLLVLGAVALGVCQRVLQSALLLKGKAFIGRDDYREYFAAFVFGRLTNVLHLLRLTHCSSW